ncbi:restriction endonuclease subunit S [Vagococcus fluvialis]|uniref:restriction endonuclease subunit S n=1 Tax=Vagococcus fluvialis TaxID=2738 RepID=UPI001D0BBD44|nr:restriction endonuclease subunit S [Vagococcus fluvialis]UDM74391.1 restriction endonuclease subunit S [Vagococcus fluvialis]
MTNINKKEPVVRFDGFTDDWEQCKLGEIVKIVMGQSPNSENYTDNPNDNILVQGNADMKNGRVVPRVWTTQITKEAEKYDLILSVRAPVGDIGKTDYNVVLGRGVAAIKGNEFIFQTLGKMKFDGYWNKLSTGSTFESINSNDIKDAMLKIPSIEEQIKIGNFFKLLDETITLQERELVLLKEQKKSLLQKMFPKNGSNMPEIRLDGFTDVWEQFKLLEGMEEYTDRVYIEDDTVYNQVSVKNIGEITLRGQQVGAKIGRKRQAKINLTEHPTTLIFTRQTIEQGGIGFAPKSTDGAIVTENMPTISVDTSVFSKDYLTSLFKTTLFRENVILPNIEGGTAQIAIHEDAVLNSELLVPSFGEQKKIGLFFKKLDETINLQERKLETLKNMKKSFLQKMFV